MKEENSIRKLYTDIFDPNLSIGKVVLYLLPIIPPIIYKAIDKFANFAGDAMEHGYDIKVKVGMVDIALIKKDF